MTGPDAAAPLAAPWPLPAGVLAGVVDAANQAGTGLKLGGTWWNVPRGYGYPLPDRGAVVALEPGGGRTFRRLAVLVPAPAPDARARRIEARAALKAVAAFVASRPTARVADVARLHAAALAWLDRPDSTGALPDEDGRIARQVALRAAAGYLAARPERPEGDLWRAAERFETLATPAEPTAPA